MKNLWFISDNSCFSSFFLSLFIFSLFLPLPFWEKSERPEKAHSSLYSSLTNLDNSQHEKRDFEGWLLSLLCCVIQTQHKQRSDSFIHYFSFHGSPDPLNGNKDKFGRLRSLCHNRRIAYWASGQRKNVQLCQMTKHWVPMILNKTLKQLSCTLMTNLSYTRKMKMMVSSLHQQRVKRVTNFLLLILVHKMDFILRPTKLLMMA